MPNKYISWIYLFPFLLKINVRENRKDQETLATLDTQDTGHRTKTNRTKHSKTQKTKMMRTRTQPKTGSLSIIRHPPFYSYNQEVFATTVRKRTKKDKLALT